jgi:cation:H+ antiporter
MPVAASMAGFDIPVMIAVMVACLPIFARGYTIPRWQGAVFLSYYVAYATYLVLDATKHKAKDGYATAMLEFVVPLTVLTLVVIALGVRRSNRSGQGA